MLRTTFFNLLKKIFPGGGQLFRRGFAFAGLAGAFFLYNLFMPSVDFRSLGEFRQGKEKWMNDLREEVRRIVRSEMIFYTAHADNAVLGKPLANDPPPARRSFSSPIPQVMERVHRHSVHKLVDAELNTYVAGSLRTESEVTEGAVEEPEPSPTDISASRDELTPPITFKQEEEDFVAGAEKEKAIERTLIQEGGLLLPRGKLQIEPSFAAAHFSSNRINIEGFSILPVLVIGEISTESVKRDILIGAMALKYGLWNNIQVEVKTPARYEFDRISSNVGDESTRKVAGLGDIESALSYQVFHDKGGWLPDTIFSVGLKTPTGKDPYKNAIGLGTGHWATRASIVGVKTSDPAVVFGILNYTWNYERDFGDFGNLDPGNSIGYGLGTAIALSYKTAINFQLEHSITTKLKRGDFPVNGSFLNSASLKTGFTWTLSEKTGIDIGATMGLTTDAPDYVIEVRVPYTF